MASFQFCEVFFCFAKILNNFGAGNVNAWGTPRSGLKFGPPLYVITFGQSFPGSSDSSESNQLTGRGRRDWERHQ